MSNWPSVSFENVFLREVVLELQKRRDSIRPLVSGLTGTRVDDLEETGGGGGGIEHERLDLEFTLFGEPPPRVSITIYDDRTYLLNGRHPYEKLSSGAFGPGRFCILSEGSLPVAESCEVARMIEQTISLCYEALEREHAIDDIRKLWETTRTA